jgi:hypothetical protein
VDCLAFFSFQVDQMSKTAFVKENPAQDIAVVTTDARADTEPVVQVGKKNIAVPDKKKKNFMQSLMNFIYNPRQKTVLGRSSLNWGKRK